MPIKKYRCKEAVQAVQWFDTEENRALFKRWFSYHGVFFTEKDGQISCLEGGSATRPDGKGDDVKQGEWVALMGEEFCVMPFFLDEWDLIE